MNRRKVGFTIVELLIVIVVVSILVSIVVVNYNGMQQRARDAKLTDAADKVADAIQLFVVGRGHFPRGGSGSTAVIGSNQECADGTNGWFATGTYGATGCTVEDTLIASGYLSGSFSANLPPNVLYNTTPYNRAIMVYIVNITTRKAMVFYSLESPTAADTAHFNDELTACGFNPSGTVVYRDTYGMRNGICFDY